MFKTVTFSILILLVVTQCTVQKRLYNSGYSVSWNKRFREEPKEKETSVYENDDVEETENVIEDSVIMETPVQESISSEDLDMLDTEDPVLFDESEIKEPLADTVYINSVNVPSGVAALSFFGGAAVAEIAGIFTALGFFAILGGVLLVVSFILAIISVVEFRRNRKLYLSNDFGVIALVIDSIVLLLAMILFLIVLFVLL